LEWSYPCLRRNRCAAGCRKNANASREFCFLISAGAVRPRTPFRIPRLRLWDHTALCNTVRQFDELAEPISDVEEDGKGIPVLIRQYAKLGGKLVAFNLDRKFSNVVDSLVILDLRQTDPAILERHMGKEGMASFRHVHNMDAVACAAAAPW